MNALVLISVSAVSILFSGSLAFAETTDTIEFSNTFYGKISIAAVSAVLSLVVGYIIYYIKDRKESRKLIVYNLEIRKGLLGIEEKLSSYLSILYRGRPANNINYVRCDLLNSGTSLIRKQKIRIEFPDEMEVLEWGVDPTPPRELGFSEVPEKNDGKNERRFIL